MSTADYQRKWRASKGARTGVPGRPVTAPCGTVSAYKRHQRKGEPVDDACREAWSQYQRDRYRARKGNLMRWVTLVALLMFAGCSVSDGNGTKLDSGALLACTAFQELADDYNAGVVTSDELRERMVGIEDDASVSTETGVASSARALLAALTQGDDSAAGDAVTAFAAACRTASGA